VYAGGLAHIRELEGGGASYCSKSSNVLHVGLGEAERIDSLVIHWPSGQVDRYEEVAMDEMHMFVERGEVTNIPTKAENPTYSIGKNPTNTTIELIGPLKEDTKWTLLNTVGQVVQSGVAEPGWGRTQLTDVSLLPQGIYYLRVQGLSRNMTFPIVVGQ
jgi:hypothetical protein